MNTAIPTILTRPTVEEVEAYAPELFALCDELAEVTLWGTVDFDSEVFDAVDAVLVGTPEDQVLNLISPKHPGAERACALLRSLVGRRPLKS